MDFLFFSFSRINLRDLFIGNINIKNVDFINARFYQSWIYIISKLEERVYIYWSCKVLVYHFNLGQLGILVSKLLKSVAHSIHLYIVCAFLGRWDIMLDNNILYIYCINIYFNGKYNIVYISVTQCTPAGNIKQNYLLTFYFHVA